MAGQYSGCQTLIRQKNPLALYFHCGAHCVNLVMESVAVCSQYLREPMQWIHELSTLSSQSGKFKAMFAGKASGNSIHKSLRPLCPTRWTVCAENLRRVLLQYESILETLHEYKCSGASTESKSRAAGLHERFSEGNTVLCFTLSLYLRCWRTCVQPCREEKLLLQECWKLSTKLFQHWLHYVLATTLLYCTREQKKQRVNARWMPSALQDRWGRQKTTWLT